MITRILHSWRSSLLGVVILAIAILLWSGPDVMKDLSGRVDALTGLVQSLSQSWVVLGPLAGYLLWRKDSCSTTSS